MFARRIVQNGLIAGARIVNSSPILAEKLLPYLRTNRLIARAVTYGESQPAASGSIADLSSDYTQLFQAGVVRQHVVVAIPIFNASKVSEIAVSSVLSNLPNWASVLLINDASTDPKISAMIAKYRDDTRIDIIENEVNLGYTANANLAFAKYPDSDVLLLNSDAVVGRGWLSSMRYVAYSSFKVATVTAVSDDHGSFSIFDEKRPKPLDLTFNELERINRNASSGHRIEVPTGNGFCIFIRRDALNEVGFYDLEKFPRGYGEENDFCLRAGRLGYKSLICDKALVSHLAGQSFGSEKEPLLEIAWERITKDYPEYPLLIDKFNGSEFKNLRRRFSDAIKTSTIDPPNLNVLYLQPIGVGGVFHANSDLRLSLKGTVQAYVLRSDGKTASLERATNESKSLELIGTWNLPDHVRAISHSSESYDRLLLDIVHKHAIDLVHVEHSVWQSLTFVEVVQSLGVPVIASLHDFYGVCPSYNLLDNEGKYCGGRCTTTGGDCKVDIWPSGQVPQLKMAFIGEWQRKFANFFQSIDALIAPSASTASIYASIYPVLKEKITVIEHGQNLVFSEPVQPKSEILEKKIRVLVVGNIFNSKGDELIAAIGKLDSKAKIEFHFLGTTSSKLEGLGIKHGKYHRADLNGRIQQIKPDIAFFASKWPETYCFVLNEVWAAGIPAFGLDLGAIGERIRSTGNGFLAPSDVSTQECYDRILEIAQDKELLQMARQKIKNWQTSQSESSQLIRMGLEYAHLYTLCKQAYTRVSDLEFRG